MNRDIEIALIEECKQNKANRTTSLGERESLGDVSRYLSPERFRLEQVKLFTALPSILLHQSELREDNAYTVVDSAIGSVIVTKDNDGKISVFRNACRHRGARLADGSGCSKLFVCPYHAWAYNNNGELVSVPGEQQCFPNLDKRNNGLIRVPSIVRYGFVWICPSAQENTQLDEYLSSHLGEMQGLLEWLESDKLSFFKRTTKTWNGNWKLFAEGGLETYHFSFAHKNTIASSFYNNTAVIHQVDKHFRVVMPTRELEKGAPTSLHDCSHTLFYVLPNSALLVQKEHVDWICFNPIDAHSTQISVTSLIPQKPDISDPAQLSHWEKNHHITNITLDEDWDLGATIQASLKDNAIPYIQYGRNEWALAALNKIIDDLIQA